MRVQLRDLAPGQDYAIQFRSVNADGLTSEWSQVQRFTTTNDTIRPGNVQNLSFYESGDGHVAKWDKVVVDEIGNPLRDFRHYRCQVDWAGTTADFFVTGESFDFSREMNEATFGGFKSALTLRVWAVDLTYNESNVAAVVTANPAAPPTPSTPTVGTYLGSLLVAWDGNNSLGTAMPGNINYAEVHVSTTSGFTPSTATMVGRVVTDGSGSKYVVSGLTYGTTYYVKLIAVNLHGLRSNASAQASNAPVRISGLDVENGQIGAEQINFKSTGIPGGNAYYQTTAPTGGTYTSADVWYDTDDAYKTYKWNGSAWVADTSVGFIPASKIIAGTLTADQVGTNLLIAHAANIANAIIDDAKINSLTAAKLTSGSIAAGTDITAGDATSNHCVINSNGFYVKGPQPGGDPNAPVIIDRIRMGTGASDFFAIPDPVTPDATLAQIDENGIASFQTLHAVQDITLGGRSIADMMDERGTLVGEVAVNPIDGLDQAGAQGIRSEYGIAQFSFSVVAGRSYQIDFILSTAYLANSAGTPYARVRVQPDQRTQDQIDNDTAPPTECTITSPNVYTKRLMNLVGQLQNDNTSIIYRATTTGVVTAGYFLGLFTWADDQTVIKIPNGSAMIGHAVDLGPTQVQVGALNDGGGTLYSWTSPEPTGGTPKTQYYKKYNYNWVRSYQGTGAYMTNNNGRAYQGLDPSGFNGNQIGYFGFSHINFATLLSGATVDKILIYLYFSHWYYNGGGTARVGYHNVHADPGTASRTGTIAGTFDSSSWPKPGGRKLQVTSWGAAFKDGSFRGVALGPGNNGFVNYGYATDCEIEIWYTK